MARSALARYLLWQVPGWLVVTLVFMLLELGLGLPWWVAPAGVGLFVLRDLALYPAMRAVFTPAPPPHPIGERGLAVEALHPEGLVRVRGELWRARALGGDVEAQQEVVVTEARGLTLLVRRADQA
jgi:membrane protein implicated in regulation of membrane protease activity